MIDHRISRRNTNDHLLYFDAVILKKMNHLRLQFFELIEVVLLNFATNGRALGSLLYYL